MDFIQNKKGIQWTILCQYIENLEKFNFLEKWLTKTNQEKKESLSNLRIIIFTKRENKRDKLFLFCFVFAF